MATRILGPVIVNFFVPGNRTLMLDALKKKYIYISDNEHRVEFYAPF